MTRSAEAGFTLIEALVALAVLAITSIAILGASEAHVTRIGGLEARAVAGWAAENHLAELSLGLAPAADPAPILSYPVHLETAISPTTDPDLLRIDISAGIGSGASPLIRLTGFALASALTAKGAP